MGHHDHVNHQLTARRTNKNREEQITQTKENREDYQQITIAGQEANHNRKVKDQRITIAEREANYNRRTKNANEQES